MSRSNKFSGIYERKIGNKFVGFKFGMNAYVEFCDMYKCDFAAMATHFNSSPAAMRDILFCTAAEYQRLKGKEVTFDKYVAGDWIDALGMEAVSEIINGALNAGKDEIKKVAGKKTVEKKT